MSIGIFDYKTVKPFSYIGLTGNFWTVHSEIVLATWIAMAILFCIVLLGRRYLNREMSPVFVSFEQGLSFFLSLCRDSFDHFNYYYFAFIVCIFLFTFTSSLVGILPFVEEATKDINTTLAIGVTSFLYVQYHKIRVHGIGGYLKEFAEPFFPLIPIHIVGELSKIASMSFRLFGNILGGGVIVAMVLDFIGKYEIAFIIAAVVTVALLWITSRFSSIQSLARLNSFAHFSLNILLLVAWLQIFLGIFEGMIQSFVVTMLTTTYLAIGTQHDPAKEEHGGAAC